MTDFDVLVAGCGPAGCSASYELAKRGYKTLLVDKCALPRYKSCSGMLIEKSLRLVKEYFGIEVPMSVTCTPADNKGMIFYDDDGADSTFNQSGLNVWRSAFDNLLTEKAEEAGAVVRDNTSVVGYNEYISRVNVKLKNGDKAYAVNVKYLLDCCGAVPLSVCRNRKYVITYQTFNYGHIDLDYRYFYAFLQPALSGYDAWLNVKDGNIVIGVAADNGEEKKIKDYYAAFISYLQNNYNLTILSELKTDKWIMPKIEKGCNINYGKGRIMRAGEAAGFLNPIGEGVSCALESGHCLAAALSENFTSAEDAVNKYAEYTKTLRDYMVRQWSLLGRLSKKFSHMIV